MPDSLNFFDRLRRAGLITDDAPKPAPRSVDRNLIAKPGDPSARRYALAALAAECRLLAEMPEGQRGQQANTSGFKVGTLVDTGHITEREGYEAIIAAGVACGLPLREVEQKAGGGFRAGVTKGGRVIQLRPLEQIRPAYTIDPQVESDFWTARPVHQHIRDFARSRRTAPWAVLGVVLARVAASIEPVIVLPALVGGDGSLNQFIALVGPSGGGKGAAEAAAADAVELPETKRAGIGSGEGILHQYVKYHAATKTEPGGMEQHTTRVIFSAAEVDQLAALKGRTGSTLLPMLRDAWSGAQLSFAYVDEMKRVHVAAHAYRLCLTVGVQPGRAAVLLDDVDGGTPQRFLWMPTADREVPDVAPDSPGRWKSWRVQDAPAADLFSGRRAISVCGEAVAAIDAAAVARHRGEVDALDGHALLCRLKAAAALAALDCRLEVNAADWELSGAVTAVSDATRANVQTQLHAQFTTSNTARGRADGERAVMADEVRDEAARRAAVNAIRKVLGRAPMARHEVRRAVNSRYRGHIVEALAALIETGDVVETVAGNRALLTLRGTP